MSWTLLDLGLAWLALGNYARAEKYLRGSFELAPKADRHRTSDSLEGMAAIRLRRAGRGPGKEARSRLLEEPGLLLGAADAARRLLDTPVIPARAPRHERLVAEVRSRLGEAACSAVHAAEERMSTEESISLSVQSTP